MESRVVAFAAVALVVCLSLGVARAGQQDCPAFECSLPDGKHLNGKFVDHSDPEDEAKTEEDGIVKMYYFDTSDFHKEFNDINHGRLNSLDTAFLDCALVCTRWNAEGGAPRAGYWMYELTCDDGIGGQCLCFNNDTTCAGPWWSDEYMEDWEYGVNPMAPATYYTGKLCGAQGRGEPHFTGADGSHFDFSGTPNKPFALISDAHVQVNAFFGGRYAKWDNRTKVLTWMRKVSIMWGHHVAVLSARQGSDADYHSGYLQSIVIDGEPLQILPHGKASAVGGDFEVSWTGVKIRSGRDWVDQFLVTVKDVVTLALTIRPEVPNLRTHSDAVVHFTVNVESAQLSSNAHGIIGQTFRPDFRGRLAQQKLKYSKVVNAMAVPGDNAEGFIDGSVEDYMVKDVEKADCPFCRFARASAIDEETARAIAMTVDGDVEATGRKLLRAHYSH